jgi:peptidoglycan/LPS O-acetylase OafA/YrhL
MSVHTTIEAPAAAGARTIHLNFLDGLRGMAALYVMFHHAWLTVWSGYFPGAKAGALTGWLAFGHVSVTVFIILSGFCLMLPVARGNGRIAGGSKRFIWKRARRILPPYYFALLLSCLLILTVIGKTTGTQWDITIPHSRYEWAKAIGTHVLLIQDFFDAYTLNHALWSIPVEWQIYFFFPLLVLLWRRWPGPLITTAATLAVSAWAQWWVPMHHPRMQQVNFHYLGLFAMGMLAATISFAHTGRLTVLQRPAPSHAIGWLGLLAGATVIRIFCLKIEWVTSHWLTIDILTGIAVSCLLISASLHRTNPIRAFLSLRPIVWLGTFSYSLYLIHAPLLQVLWQYVIHPLGLTNGQTFVALAMSAVPIVGGCAWLFHLCFERPFMNHPPKVTSPA